MGKKNLFKDVLELSSKFVQRHSEGWSHKEWEKLVAEVEELGIVLDEAGRVQLGKSIEAARELGAALPAPQRKRKEAAREAKKANAAAGDEKPKRKRRSKTEEAPGSAESSGD